VIEERASRPRGHAGAAPGLVAPAYGPDLS